MGGLGDGPTFAFGLLLTEPVRSKLNVPGPGAYAPRDVSVMISVKAPARMPPEM